jgi:hypothetical protein
MTSFRRTFDLSSDTSVEIVPNLRRCAVLKRLRIALAGGMYYDLQAYLSRVLSGIVSPSFSTFIVRHNG